MKLKMKDILKQTEFYVLRPFQVLCKRLKLI